MNEISERIIHDAPRDAVELEVWLSTIPQDGPMCPIGNCGQPLTRAESLNDRCEAHRVAYLEAAGLAVVRCAHCDGSGWERSPSDDRRVRRCRCRSIKHGGESVTLARLKRAGLPEAYWQMTRVTADRPWIVVGPGGAEHSSTWPAAVDAWCSEPSGTLYIHGKQGRGKTHLAVAAFREAMVRHEALVYASADCLRYVEALRRAAGHGTDEGEAMEDHLAHADILFLDDLIKGRDAVTPFYGEAMQRLLRYRHARGAKATVITSEYDLGELADRLDASLVSRLVESGRVVALGGPDRRLRQ